MDFDPALNLLGDLQAGAAKVGWVPFILPALRQGISFPSSPLIRIVDGIGHHVIFQCGLQSTPDPSLRGAFFSSVTFSPDEEAEGERFHHTADCSLIEPMRTKGDTILITGASSGIGKATAQLFAEKGFLVFGTSRQQRQSEDGIEMLKLDVRSGESVQRCVQEVLKRTGRIDVLVNNAGIMHQGTFAEETSIEEARAIFETNLFGVVRMTNAVLPGMRARGRGRIINVGSLAAWVGEPGEAFYSASKHALAGYTEALRHEVWPLGIHVSLVEPGAFRTNIYRESGMDEVLIADYDEARRAVRNIFRKAATRGDDPRKVARLIFEIANASQPRLRYAIGGERWLPYLKVLLPQGAFDYLLRRGFKLPRSRGGHHG